jgi:cytochrome c oxidase cbb3-type subunit 4
MDINVLRGLIAVASLVVFVGIVLWAWSGRQRKRFEEAAMLPFRESDELQAAASTKARRSGQVQTGTAGATRPPTNPARKSAE